MGTHHSTTDTLILSTLDLLQGTLLLHPPSRSLFAHEDSMNLLLDLLDTSLNPAPIQSQALLVLVTALLDSPANTRTFEAVEGLLTVTSLFKDRGAAREVKMRTLEFLYFYLMPESAVQREAGERSPSEEEGVRRQESAKKGHARTHSLGDGTAAMGDGGDAMDVDDEEEVVSGTKSTEEKQRLLGRHLNNVAELVQDLQENAVFGAAAAAGG